MPNIINWPAQRVIKLRNVTCAYCGLPFDDKLVPTIEHVIARRFVPRGCFDRQWNLILNACTKCNNEKSDLEDDISAISMLPDLTGRFAIDDPRLAAEARRKAINARSRRTKKTVANSHEKIVLERKFGSTSFTFNFTSPAQIDENRVFNLAKYHFTGFFYWITYKEDPRLGHFILGDFFPLLTAKRADWGSTQLRWFMNHVRDWRVRVHAIGADGFFKILIRRDPQDRDVWAWAVEWNHGIRVAGFAGDRAMVETFASDIPALPFRLVHQDANSWTRARTEIPLPESEDDLFTMPDHSDTQDHRDAAIV
jgi:hypothetical protein